MRILVLSFYYPPDIGPGPLRAASIVESLVREGGPDVSLNVMTNMPNRYQSISLSATAFEQNRALTVRRFSLPPHQSGMADQAKAFLVYAKSVLKATKGQQWDIVFSTSSRLMTASLGAWVAKKSGAKLYLDIRDLFTDTMGDLLSKSVFRFLLPIFRVLERWTFRSADHLNVVSLGFLSHIEKVAPEQPVSVLTNGIDDEFLDTDFSPVYQKEPPLVLYAGNMGQGQGLHQIVPAVAASLSGSVKLKLIGAGGERESLARSIAAFPDVQISDPVSRSVLLDEYKNADVLFLHLNDYAAFRKVLPSKIFEYAATGKPILAGVAGYAAEFLRNEVLGVEVFDPCDARGMRAGLQNLLDGPRMIDRSDFCSRYRRKNIMQKMAKDILSLENRF